MGRIKISIAEKLIVKTFTSHRVEDLISNNLLVKLTSYLDWMNVSDAIYNWCLIVGDGIYIRT